MPVSIQNIVARHLGSVVPSRHLLPLAFLFLCFAPIASSAENTADKIPEITFSGASLNVESWQLVGPFRDMEPRKERWDREFLNIDLLSIDTDPLLFINEAVAQWNSASPSSLGADLASAFRSTTRSALDLQREFGRSYARGPIAYAYAISYIHSSEAHNAVGLLGSSDGARLWLNGKMLLDRNVRRGLSLYNDSFPMQLKKGRNMLIVKVGRWNSTWSLALRIVPNAESAMQTAITNAVGVSLFPRSVVESGSDLIFSSSGFPEGVDVSARILNSKRAIVWVGTLKTGFKCTPLSELPAGSYELEIVNGSKSLSAAFVVGGMRRVEDAAGSVLKTDEAIEDGTKLEIQIFGLRRRIAAVLNPDVKQSDGHRERQLARAVFELDSALAFREVAGADSRGLPVLPGVARFYSFRSGLDRRVQTGMYYLKGKSGQVDRDAPLIVVLPTVISANRPFERSPFAGDISTMQKIAWLAEQEGFSVFWCGYRAQPSGRLYETAHILEGIRNLCADYDIAPRKIIALGACSGGAISTHICTDAEAVFDGVALLNPVFELQKKVSNKMTLEFLRNQDFLNWITEPRRISDYSKLKIPTFVVHDGAEPGHGSIDVALEFVSKLKDESVAVTFSETDQPFGDHLSAWSAMFAWAKNLCEQPANDRTSPRNLQIDEGYKLGFTDALSGKFLVIRPTQGDFAALHGGQTWINRFAERWKEHCFANLPVVDDVAFDEAYLTANTIIVVGDQETNSQWNRFAPPYGISFTNGTLGNRERNWKANGIGGILVEKDTGSEKTVIFVSVHPGDHVPDFDPCTEGWFSNFVWAKDGARTYTLAAERRRRQTTTQ